MNKINSRKRSTMVLSCLTVALLIGLSAVVTGCSKNEEPANSEVTQSSQSIAQEVDDVSLFAQGTTIESQDISGKTLEEALAVGRKYLGDTLEDLEISIKFQDDTVLLRGDDFVIQDVLDLTLPGILDKREGGDYKIQYVVDLSEAGTAKLNQAAQGCYSEGQNAKVTGFNRETQTFTFEEEVTGVRVDMNQTMESIRQLLSQKHGGALQAEFIEVKPTVEKSQLAENFDLIASYTTTSTNTSNGNNNMKLALSHVNGTILDPGQVFSYNGTIGDSTTTANGYLAANGISGGVMVPMIGGGICQGSSTVYGAAIRAGLEIVERHNHGIQSSYCPTGQDAMVSYGSADLRIKNNMDTPIYFVAYMDDVVLYVEIYGVQPEEWDEIKIESWVVGTTPALTTSRYNTVNSMNPGESKLESAARKGVESAASRAYYKNGTLIRTEELPYSRYPASGNVYSVGPGTKTDATDAAPPANTGGGNTASTPAADTPKPEQPQPETPAPQTPVEETPSTPTAEETDNTSTDTSGNESNTDTGTDEASE